MWDHVQLCITNEDGHYVHAHEARVGNFFIVSVLNDPREEAPAKPRDRKLHIHYVLTLSEHGLKHHWIVPGAAQWKRLDAIVAK